MNPLWLETLSRQGAVFLDGRVTRFEGLPPSSADAFLCDLSHEGVIQVGGADAASFLHAQLSNDVLGLADGVAQWNSWCSPKGRMLATMLVWKHTDGFSLQLPRSLQAAIQKRLQMFVLRAKVELKDAAESNVRFGICGKAAATLLAAEIGALPARDLLVTSLPFGQVIRLSPARFEVSATAENGIALWNRLAEKSRRIGAAAWDRQLIAEGIITVLPETQDQFVPQMANFELIGGISFHKGCYPGQEIVARTQYRGILKRRLAHVQGSGDAPRPGTPVYSTAFGEQAAGTITNAAPCADGGFDALVVAQVEAIKANTMHLGIINGSQLTVHALPYPVPDTA